MPLSEVSFVERDDAIVHFHNHEEVVLWFEHDLYDQLQLIQILDWFAAHDGADLPLYLICVGSYPGVPKFSGLGQLTAAQLRPLLDRRHRVKSPELAAGQAAW